MHPSGALYKSCFTRPDPRDLIGPEFSNPYFGSREADQFEGIEGKSEKVHGFYTPIVKLMTYLYLHPQKVQKLLPDFLSPYMPFETFKKIAKPFQEVSFKTKDNVNLTGYWFPSDNPKASKTMILGHGYYANATTMYPLAEELLKEGWNVFMFDFRAHGRSEGEQTSIGFHEGSDVLAAVQTVKQTFPNASNTLYYLSHSMAAAALMLTPESLKDDPDALKLLNNSLDGLVLDSSYSHLNVRENPFVTQLSSYQPQNTILSWFWRPVQPIVSHLVEKVAAGFNESSKEALDLPLRLDKIETAPIFRSSPLMKKPILMLHGRKDRRTSYTQGQDIHRILKTPCFVSLDSDHIGKGLKKKKGDKGYKSVLRDEEQYLKALKHFLGQIKD